MKLTEALRIVRLRTPRLDPTARALAGARAVADFARSSQRLLPRAVADYLEGGADRERSLALNEAAFARYALVPRVLRDVSEVDLATDLLGRRYAAPIGLSPTGMNRSFHPDGEVAVGRAALAHGVPYGLSTVASASVGDLYRETGAPAGSFWFQLYVFSDREHTWRLLDEAAAAGVEVLEVAVDAPVAANRLRDSRSGLGGDLGLRWRSALDLAAHPRYWTRLLDRREFTAPHLGGGRRLPAPPFDATLSFDDLADLRRRWPGRLLLKGLLDVADARRAVEAGVDGFHLSNHGGRQLDQAVSPLTVLPRLRDELGPEVALVVDSGVRTGGDVAIALALGADAAFVGRPYLWALATAGEAGVRRAIEILTTELTRTLQLLGYASVAELRDAGTRVLRPADAVGLPPSSAVQPVLSGPVPVPTPDSPRTKGTRNHVPTQ